MSAAILAIAGGALAAWAVLVIVALPFLWDRPGGLRSAVEGFGPLLLLGLGTLLAARVLLAISQRRRDARAGRPPRGGPPSFTP